MPAPRDDELAALLTREKVEALERIFSDPNSSPTEEDAELWFAAVRRSEPPAGSPVIIEEGEDWPPETPEDRAWDDWYARPISESLFPNTGSRRSLERKPVRIVARRPRPRGARARRVRRRTVRKAGGRAGPSDREPEPPLLSVVPLERFRRDVDRWLSVAA